MPSGLRCQCQAQGLEGGLLREREVHMRKSHHDWLVVTGTWLLSSHILGIIIPTDFHIFQRSWNHQPDDSGKMWEGRLIDEQNMANSSYTCWISHWHVDGQYNRARLGVDKGLSQSQPGDGSTRHMRRGTRIDTWQFDVDPALSVCRGNWSLKISTDLETEKPEMMVYVYSRKKKRHWVDTHNKNTFAH